MINQLDYASMEDERLVELLFTGEDRLGADAAEEIARRDSLAPYLAQIVMDKQSWLAELPDWWAVVHATYILGHRGGEEAVVPLLAALRWADAFDCDWVGEVLPSLLGHLGPPVIPGLTAVVRDQTAGWSARDLAMKGLAAVALRNPDSSEHAFRLLGERLMDEGEERVVRQLAGQILLDFRRQEYRLALLKFARDEQSLRDTNAWLPVGFCPEDVEIAFHSGQPETWHYQEPWMRFYEPAEIQRRQKRWNRERLGSSRDKVSLGGGQLLSFWRGGQKTPPPSAPEAPGPDESNQD
ncbi:MAG: hypothetical protein PVG03_04245 [Desulfarculaceae bacterium]|jgi:hypothetical protein